MLENVPYPRLALLSPAVRGEPDPEAWRRHDLVVVGPDALGLAPDREPAGLAEGFTPASLRLAQQRAGGTHLRHPEAVLLCEVSFYEYRDDRLPEEHPWWLREEGERVPSRPGYYRLNWEDPEYRSHVARLTVALTDTGIDGVFYDHLRPEARAPWTAFLKEVRLGVGSSFLLLASLGDEVSGCEYLLPLLNGVVYEAGWCHDRTDWEECVRAMQRNEVLLRPPRISVVECFAEADAPAEAARRSSLCYALTVGDYYYLSHDRASARRPWPPEYEAKIGHPLEPGKQISSHVWRRPYDRALVVVNLPGAAEAFTVRVGRPAWDAFTGETGTEFTLPPGDGRILVTQP